MNQSRMNPSLVYATTLIGVIYFILMIVGVSVHNKSGENALFVSSGFLAIFVALLAWTLYEYWASRPSLNEDPQIPHGMTAVYVLRKSKHCRHQKGVVLMNLSPLPSQDMPPLPPAKYSTRV